MIRRTEKHCSGAGGNSLFQRAWLAPEPARLVLLVHGYAEHSGRYEAMGAWLAERGCAVVAYDQQGHGHSRGRRGHVRAFGDLLDDLDAILDAARQEHPGLPCTVVGHSMGGLVVAAWACERDPEIDGAVLSGAALRLAGAPPSWQVALLRTLRAVAPRLVMTRRIAPEALSRDPEVGRAYIADPLVFQELTVSLAAGLFDAARRTLDAGAQLRVPLLVLHGAEDPLCLPSGSADFFEQVTATGSELRIYPELRHEIFNEPEREALWADLLDWVKKRETGA